MSEAGDLVPPTAEVGLGRTLAQARGERNLSVADVAQRLKYGVRQIEALEAEEFGRLPGTTFVRGMTRSYAKFLEIDPQPLLKALERRQIPAETAVEPRAKRIPFPEGGKRGTRVYLAVPVLVVFAVLAVLYEWQGGTPLWHDEAARSVPPAPAVKPEPPISPPAAHADATAASRAVAAEPTAAITHPTPDRAGDLRRIQLEFERESWVEIKEKGGKTLLSQLNSGGTQQVVEGVPPFSLIIGNAAAVRLTYDDTPVDLKRYVKIEVARLTLD